MNRLSFFLNGARSRLAVQAGMLVVASILVALIFRMDARRATTQFHGANSMRHADPSIDRRGFDLSDQYNLIYESQLVGFICKTEEYYMMFDQILNICSNYYNKEKPNNGDIDLVRAVNSPKELLDVAYWKNYQTSLDGLRLWLERDKARIQSIKAFARKRFPAIQFRQPNRPPQHLASSYPHLPPNPPSSHLPPPPPE